MQKNKVKKIICITLSFLLTVYVVMTYLSTAGFNFISFGKSVGLLFSESHPQNYDREYIVENQKNNFKRW